MLGFLKAVEKEQPDIIGLQEVGNKIIPIKGYHHFISPSAENANQHGASLYTRTSLGTPETRNPHLANIVHLVLKDLPFEIINIYVAPFYNKGTYSNYIRSLFNR